MINVQLRYALAEREIETEHVPLGRELGLGITAWSPLAGGFLTGKYRHGTEGRFTGQNTQTWYERDWELLLKPLEEVAAKLGVTMAQVAINWVATQPGIASAIVGASNAGQLTASMAALDFELPPELRATLDEA